MAQYKPSVSEPSTTITNTTPPTDDMRYTFLISLAICATILAIIAIFAMRRAY